MGSIHAEDVAISEDGIDELDAPDEGSVEEANVKTYTDLFNQINGTEEGSTLTLTEDYRFNSTSDESFASGIPISRNITIVGGSNPVFIDGNRLARGFCIDSNCHLVLENIIFKNCYYKGNGGGIYLNSSSTLNLTGCSFENNCANGFNGGAI